MSRHAAGNGPVLLTLHLYLWASAFGALTLPGINVTYANAGLPMLLVVALRARPSAEEWVEFLLMGGAMALDLIFREFTLTWSAVGYSANIGKIMIFILVAARLSALPIRHKNGLVLSFGLAAIMSEVFALLNPSYRMSLFNAESIGEGFGIDLFRPTGLIGDPNYFALPVCLMAVAAMHAKRYGLLLLALAFVVASGSRSAVIAVVLPIFLMQIQRHSNHPAKMLLIAGGYCGIFAAMILANAILRDGTTSESNMERAGLLIQSFENIASFSFLDATYGQPISKALDGDFLVVHNTFLQTLSTSLMLGVFYIVRLIRGFARPDTRMLLLCIAIEMLFLDISAHSSFVLLFLILTAPLPRTDASASVSIS